MQLERKAVIARMVTRRTVGGLVSCWPLIVKSVAPLPAWEDTVKQVCNLLHERGEEKESLRSSFVE